MESPSYLYCTRNNITNITTKIWRAYENAPSHHLNSINDPTPTITENAYAGLHYEALDASLAKNCDHLLTASHA